MNLLSLTAKPDAIGLGPYPVNIHANIEDSF